MRALGFGAVFDAFNKLNNDLSGGSSEGLPPGRICDMGGECVWRRIK